MTKEPAALLVVVHSSATTAAGAAPIPSRHGNHTATADAEYKLIKLCTASAGRRVREKRTLVKLVSPRGVEVLVVIRNVLARCDVSDCGFSLIHLQLSGLTFICHYDVLWNGRCGRRRLCGDGGDGSAAAFIALASTATAVAASVAALCACRDLVDC